MDTSETRTTRTAAALLLVVIAILLYPIGIIVESAGADTGGGTPSTSVVPDAVSDSVAATPAEFRVDESGAATYSIPIYTVPGTAGVVPQLSLNYSSQGGYGPLGKGWSIGGVSAITRCRGTREAGDFISTGPTPDGNPRPVNYTASDRYCLDGQRLLPGVGGAACPAVSGMAVETLRTEIESFQRVCAYTPSGNPAIGPAFFTVERKDGSTSWYGDRDNSATANRADAYVETNAPGHTAKALMWAQTRFQDSTGNYIDYLYHENPGSPAASSEHLLAEVRFTGKTVLSGQSGTAQGPYAKVMFNYAMRPEAQRTTGYGSAGATFVQRWRLDNIMSCATAEPGHCTVATQARHYRLSYATSASGSGMEVLSSVQECRDSSASSVCAAATLFEWTAGKHEFATLEKPAAFGVAIGLQDGYKMGDIDGDGRPDIVFIRGAGHGCAAGSAVVGLSRLDASGRPIFANWSSVCLSANIQARGEGAWHLIDYDGDGRDDLFVSRGVNQGWQIHPSNGTGFNASVDLIAGLSPAIPSLDNPKHQVHLADLNGDGLLDVVYVRTGAGVKARLMVRQGAGFGWGPERNIQLDQGSLGPTLCQQFTGHTECSRSFTELPVSKTGFVHLADFNGDASSDLIFQVTEYAMYLPPGCRRGDPCHQQIQVPRFHAFTVQTISDTEIVLTNYSSLVDASIDSLILADINADGLTDLFYRITTFPGDGQWRYRINTGTGFTSGTLLSLSGFQDQARFVDVNGDGRTDMLYLVDIGGNKIYYVRHALPEGGFAAGVPLPGGNARSCEGSGCNPGLAAPLFADLDGDGNLDFMSLRIQNNPTAIVSRSNSRFAPRDTIVGIQNGYGATTVVAYAPLTNKDLYRRDHNSRNTTNWGRGAPVTDLLAPMYAVASASSSSPQPGNPNAMARVHYRYAGAKMQAGGRGFLGFREIVSFDPNQHASQHVATTTVYAQNFPFTGMPASTVKAVVSSAYAVPGCLGGAITDTCFATPGQAHAAVGGSAFSSSTQVWEADTDIAVAVRAYNPAEQRPIHVRTAGTEEVLRDPFTGANTSRVETAFVYGAYGNVTQTDVQTKTGASALVSTVVTVNQYAQDNATRWRLGRLTQSTVTHSRPSRDDVIRYALFRYDVGDAYTGLLIHDRVGSETTSGSPEQNLLKAYTLDEYGNRTVTTYCAKPATTATCLPTIAAFHPTDPLSIRRYSRAVYDSRGRYPVETWEPFRTASGHAEARTQRVVGRDIFGNVTRAHDVNGLDSFAVPGALSRPYYAWTETVPGSTPGDPLSGVASTVTYRWCTGASGPVTCPAGAKVRQETTATAAPSQWAYLDVLGREILKVTETFNVGTTQAYSAVCTGYDAAGRVSRVSNPFFLWNSNYSGACTAASLQWTVTTYDVLGRPTRVDAPKDGGGTVFSTVAYSGLTTTTTDPRGNATAQLRNALGELVRTTDALGTQLNHVYYADGTLYYTRRNVGRGNIDNVFVYDASGRKIQQTDPDSGVTQFQYNAMGELIAQIDAAGNRTEHWYDARGRVWRKLVKRADGLTESDAQYVWDPAANGRGQLASESISGTYDAWIGQSGVALNASRSYSYDTLGRPLGSTTLIDGVSYPAATQYDTLGRPWKVQDASGRWAKTQHNALGFATAVCDSTAADTVTTCPNNANTWLRTLETNAWGHVLRERRGNSAAMDVTREYWTESGRAKRICAGNASSCGLMDELYGWDNAGNLSTQVKETRYQENFTYDALNRLVEGRVVMRNGITANIVTLNNAYDRLGNVCQSFTFQFTYQGRGGCGLDTAQGSGGTGTVGPHRVSRHTNSAGAHTDYYYDGRGNQTIRQASGSTRTIRYSFDDKAHEIDLNGAKTRFWYGSDGQRYKREHGGKRTLYLGNVEIETVGTTTTIKRTVAGVMLQTIVGSTATNHYLFHDHLGSLVKTTNASGTGIDSLDYRHFGHRRSYTDPATPIETAPSLTARGFTGHEHVDAAGMQVIHMNGRIYDPSLNRFLQADPVIQAPGNLQSWNAYTYVFNNPLAYTDPTGEFSWKKWWRPIVAIVVSVVTYGAASGWAAGWLSASVTAGTMSATTAGVFAGAIGGAAAGFTAGAITTGSLKGAVRGAFSGALFGGVGGYYGDTWNWGRVGAESLTGGISAEIGGGDFWDGFKFTFAISTLTLANYHMRASERALSSINPDNLGTDSSGFFGDGVGLAGARRQVGPDGKYLRCVSPAGGCQGQPMLEQDQLNNFFGIGGPYKVGSVRDRINESFAGPHDWFRNHVSRAYDPVGNGRVFTGFRLRVDQFANGALIPAAAPFAASAMLMTQRGLYTGYQVGYMRRRYG